MKTSALFLALALSASSAQAQTLAANPKAQSAVARYADSVYQVYTDAVVQTTALQAAVDAFLASPSAQTQQAAKDAWVSARTIWGQTEAFRFYEGPIDDATYGVEGLINAWPLDEAYIDYVAGNANAGIINNPVDYPLIDAETLVSLNEAGAETNVATGYHAVEFLLWGQDLSPTGAGARSYTDFVVGSGASNVERRRAYLKAVTDLLLSHVQTVHKAWDSSDAASYASKFRQQPAEEAFGKVFLGLSSLLTDELAGERMYVGYESQSQEDEHSCFSDMTHLDIIENVQGTINVWTGAYGTVDGVGLDELVAAVDPALARKVTRQLTSTLAAAKALPTPYDSLLVAPEDSEERKVFLDTILTIQDAGTAVKEAAEALGLTIVTN